MSQLLPILRTAGGKKLSYYVVRGSTTQFLKDIVLTFSNYLPFTVPSTILLEHRQQWIKATISLGRWWNVITCQFQTSHMFTDRSGCSPPPPKKKAGYSVSTCQLQGWYLFKCQNRILFREIIITTEGQWTMSETFYGSECTGFHYMTMRKPGLSAELLYARSLS